MSGNEALRRELTIQRRIYEHEREKAKRDLAHAQQQISRIDADYLRCCAQADRNPQRHDPAEGHGAKHESPVVATSDDAPNLKGTTP